MIQAWYGYRRMQNTGETGKDKSVSTKCHHPQRDDQKGVRPN